MFTSKDVNDILSSVANSIREEGRKKGIKVGIRQGMQQGIIKTAREDVIDSLEARFDVVPESIIKTINEINDPSVLRILLRKAVKVESLDEFTQVAKLILE